MLYKLYNIMHIAWNLNWGWNEALCKESSPKIEWIKDQCLESIEILNCCKTLFMSVLTYKHRKCHNEMSWQYTATSCRGGYNRLEPWLLNFSPHHFSFYLWKNFVTGSVEMHITNAKRMNIFLEIHNTHKIKDEIE